MNKPMSGRSRMKSDKTTKSAGYTAVLAFNLRQLARHLAGEARPKAGEMLGISANHAEMDEKIPVVGVVTG
jgi:transposase, IS5 family